MSGKTGSDNMFKVLFVDDEPLIREGMVSLIDWENYGYQVIGSAENGKKGLEKIREHQPDLVFVDIQMPGLSGIEMVTLAKNEGFLSKFVVLSGYSEFSYAQQSIQLGMESYLLKPIEEGELVPLIQHLHSKLLKEYQLHEQIQQYEEISEITQWENYLFRNQYHTDWVKRFSSDIFYLASILFEQDVHIPAMESKFTIFKEKVYKYMWKDQRLYLLFRNEPLKEVKQTMKWIGKHLTTNAPQFQLLEAPHDIENLPKQIEQLRYLQALQYSYSEIDILTEKDLKTPAETNFNREKWLKELARAIEFRDTTIIGKHVDMLQSYYQATHFPKDRIITEVLDMLRNLYQKIQSENLNVLVPNNERMISSFSSTKNLQQLLITIKEQLKETSKQINAFVSNTDNIIEKMESYVEQYYYKDLNVKMMADLFKYNSSYLGKKFKKHTGSYFHQYLDLIRLTKAKQFLKEGKWKVYQVSEKVGYTNHDYFYKKFKRNVGVSPKEYQKTYREIKGNKHDTNGDR